MMRIITGCNPHLTNPLDSDAAASKLGRAQHYGSECNQLAFHKAKLITPITTHIRSGSDHAPQVVTVSRETNPQKPQEGLPELHRYEREQSGSAFAY